MIFLFHAPEDEEFAEYICEEFKVIGEVKMWAENNNLASPPERTEAMKRDLDNAQFKVIVFSKDAFERRRPRELLREFDNLVKTFKSDREVANTFFPIRVDDCLLPVLEEHFPYYTLFEEGGLEQVIRVIQRSTEQRDQEESWLDGTFLFYKKNWKWILQFQDNPIVGDHRCHTGFTYLHFVLNSGLQTISIHRLKKVVTKLYQPSRNELLGLNEDGEKISSDPYKQNGSEGTPEEDIILFRQIRDEIIYAIQSLPAGTIRDLFMDSIKFGGDEYIIYNPYWLGRKVPWTLYWKE